MNVKIVNKDSQMSMKTMVKSKLLSDYNIENYHHMTEGAALPSCCATTCERKRDFQTLKYILLAGHGGACL